MDVSDAGRPHNDDDLEHQLPSKSPRLDELHAAASSQRTSSRSPRRTKIEEKPVREKASKLSKNGHDDDAATASHRDASRSSHASETSHKSKSVAHYSEIVDDMADDLKLFAKSAEKATPP